jgi:probable HAF family extracellular repeat protein
MRNKVRFLVLVVGLVIGWNCMAGSLEAASYKFTDLQQGFPNDPGDLVTAINDANQIVGYYYAPFAPNGGSQGYFYDLITGSFIWLQPLGGDYPNSYAYGINKLGQIVGSCSNTQNTVSVACVWTDPAQAPTMLSTLPNYTSGHANAINDNGLIVGYAYNNNDTQHACKWTITAPDQPVDLGALGGSSSAASSVNNAGQIVGWAANAQEEWQACLWNPGPQAIDVPLWAPVATGINNLGNVVGGGQDILPATYGFFWDQQTAQTQVFTQGQDRAGEAAGLSNANQVVGTWWPGPSGVFSWTPGGGLQDLNTLIVNLPPDVTVDLVNLISPKGNILARQSNGNSCLLTPVAASPANDLLLLLQ